MPVQHNFLSTFVAHTWKTKKNTATSAASYSLPSWHANGSTSWVITLRVIPLLLWLLNKPQILHEIFCNTFNREWASNPKRFDWPSWYLQVSNGDFGKCECNRNKNLSCMKNKVCLKRWFRITWKKIIVIFVEDVILIIR